MAEREPEFLEMCLLEVEQRCAIDVVVGERPGVLRQPQIFEEWGKFNHQMPPPQQTWIRRIPAR